MPANGPNNANAYHHRGAIYAARGDHSKALDDFVKVIEIDPKNFHGFQALGELMMAEHDFDRAIVAYSEVIGILPDDVDAYYQRGNAHRYRKEPAAAIDDFTKAIRLYPQSALAYGNRGLVYLEQGKEADAKKDFDQCFKLSNRLREGFEFQAEVIRLNRDPGSAEANHFFEAGLMQAEVEDDARAIANFTRAIELNPKHSAAYTSRAFSKTRKKDYEGAIQDYTKAIELNPGHSVLYVSRGSAFLSLHNVDAAMGDAEKAIAADPRNSEAYVFRAGVYFARHQDDLAATDYAKAIEVNPYDDDAFGNLGSIFLSAGEVEKAAFARDLGGSNGSLRTYATLENFNVWGLHADNQEATVRAKLHYSTAVGPLDDVRDIKVRNDGSGTWKVVWPTSKVPKLAPQVIPVNYLRWDVINRGAEDDWGVQNVDSPQVRIVSMNALQRPDRVVILGEIVNEDTVPAYVNVNAALLGPDGNPVAQETSFDKISHILLPKQVSPFRIDFPAIRLPDVDSVRLQPSSSLVAASADPVIGIESQKLNPVPDSSLTGELVNQSGQAVNVAHVLGTFYDNSGQILWVADQYPSAALLPQTPSLFSIPIPADIANKVKNYRVVVSTYSSDRLR